MIPVGVAGDRHLARADAFGRAVAALHGFRRIAVQLDQHRVINVVAKGFLDRAEICLVPVRRQSSINQFRRSKRSGPRIAS